MEAIRYEVPRRHLYQLSPFGTRQYQQKHKYKNMSQDIDILNQLDSVDLSTVETAFPLLKAGNVLTTISECKFTKDEGDDKKPYCLIKYTLAQPWETVTHGDLVTKPINVGFPITQRVYVGQYEDQNDGGKLKWYGLPQLTLLRECVFGKAPPGTKFNPAEMIGQNVTVKLKFDPAPVNKKTKEVYGPQTVVDGYVRKAAS